MLLLKFPSIIKSLSALWLAAVCSVTCCIDYIAQQKGEQYVVVLWEDGSASKRSWHGLPPPCLAPTASCMCSIFCMHASTLIVAYDLVCGRFRSRGRRYRSPLDSGHMHGCRTQGGCRYICMWPVTHITPLSIFFNVLSARILYCNWLARCAPLVLFV